MGGSNIDRLDAAQRLQAEQFAKKNHVSLEVAAGILFPSNLKFEGDVLQSENLPKHESQGEKKSHQDIYSSDFYTSPENSLGKKILGGIGAAITLPFMLLTSCTKQELNLNISMYENKTNEELIKLLKENNKNLKEVVKILNDLRKDNATQIKILLALSADEKNFNNDVKELLERINIAVDKGNGINGNNNRLLTEILDMLGKFNFDQDNNLTDILAQILAKVTENVEQNKTMGDANMEMLKKILTAIEKIDIPDNSKLEALVTDLINTVASIDIPDNSKLEALVADLINTVASIKIPEVDTSGLQERLDTIIGLIANIQPGESTDMTNVEALLGDIKNALNILPDIKTAIEGLGKDNKDIIAQLTAGNAKLDDIRKLLENIDKTTTSSDTKLGLLGITVNNLYDDFSQYGPDVTDLLTKILAKIPEGCHCPDYTNVFAEIKIIIQEIKDKMGDDKDPKHEGVLDDLDDLFA